MGVKVTGTAEVTVTGNIKNMEDYQEIKDTVKSLVSGGSKAIMVKIPESMSMTSSVIGFFLKIINGDHVKITMLVKDERLYSLLDAMKLINILNVQKM